MVSDMSNYIVRNAIDALMYGFSTYGFVNFVSHYVPATGHITEPIGLYVLVGLFFVGRLILNAFFPSSNGS